MNAAAKGVVDSANNGGDGRSPHVAYDTYIL